MEKDATNTIGYDNSSIGELWQRFDFLRLLRVHVSFNYTLFLNRGSLMPYDKASIVYIVSIYSSLKVAWHGFARCLHGYGYSYW